jgi:hypothetical protein
MGQQAIVNQAAFDIGQMTEQKQSDRGEIIGLRGYACILQHKAT